MDTKQQAYEKGEEAAMEAQVVRTGSGALMANPYECYDCSSAEYDNHMAFNDGYNNFFHQMAEKHRKEQEEGSFYSESDWIDV